MNVGKSITENDSYGLYIHIPFCTSKCSYCQFVSLTEYSDIITPYLSALKNELRLRQVYDHIKKPQTIYIGGGTPSVVPSDSIISLLEDITDPETCEITVEVNPESVSLEWLSALRDAGVTRLSVGIQSFDNTVLQTLGRIHDSRRACDALHMAADAGFENISVDLIYGVPGQDMNSLKHTLETLSSFPVKHISCYGLSIEEDTKFWHMVSNNQLPYPEQDSAASMYGMITAILTENCFKRYEISNFAYPGYECKHNKSYWNFTPYLGVGLAAHSFDGNNRYWNVSDMKHYLEYCERKVLPVENFEVIDGTTRLIELFMLSLRTSRGMSIDVLLKLPDHTRKTVLNQIDMYLTAGFMSVREPGYYILSESGIVLADEILAELTANID